MYEIENQNKKQFLLTVIKEELRIQNKKFPIEVQKRREESIEYSATAILLYDAETAEKLITSYYKRILIKKIKDF